MERRKFIVGLCCLFGVILGTLFTNIMYQDYYMYGNQLSSFVLKNQKMTMPKLKLFCFLCFKRGKQYAIFYLLGYLLQPMAFLVVVTFGISFLIGSMISMQVLICGFQGVIQLAARMVPHYISYGCAIYLLYLRNVKEKEGDMHVRSMKVEVVFVGIGIILECIMNVVFFAK